MEFQKENPGYKLDITFCVITPAIQKYGEAVYKKLSGKTTVIDDDYRYVGNGLNNRMHY